MARSARDPAPVSSIQERLTEAAHAFAQEILRVLSISTLAELSLLTGRRDELAELEAGQGAVRPGKLPTVLARTLAKIPPAKPKKKPNPRISAVRKEAGTKPVGCPVPGCNEPGIRSKMNFCRPHAESLTRPEKVRMRQEQRARKLGQPLPPAPAPAPEVIEAPPPEASKPEPKAKKAAAPAPKKKPEPAKKKPEPAKKKPEPAKKKK